MKALFWLGAIMVALLGNPGTAAAQSFDHQLFEIRTNGSIWRVGNCSFSACQPWQMLDNNPASMAIAAGADSLYQLQTTGRILRWNNDICVSASCPAWQTLDNNPATVAIAAAGDSLYKLHGDGKIYRYAGASGWQMLDHNPATKSIVASGHNLYQMHASHAIFRYTGSPCNTMGCTGWTVLGYDPGVTAIAGGGGSLYALSGTGRIWRMSGGACSSNMACWTIVQSSGNTQAIVAAGATLYRLDNGGGIFRFKNPTWEQVDNQAASVALGTDGKQLFQLQGNGKILVYDNHPCIGTSCAGWVTIGAPGSIKAIAGLNP